MEHYTAAKLIKIGTNGELMERCKHIASVIDNRVMNGQNADATRAELATIKAEIKRRTA